jgi:Pentapeptide repeats (8 copies)
VAFFVISPVLFVLLQFYVLLQTLLLGRTAKAYNDELDHTVKASSDNAVFRERLANTIFAQIFAGAPRERDGWVGNILLGIAWFTLIVSPILVLLTFQFAFLPYHSQGVTWVHRGLIYAELVILFTLWPAVLDPAKEFDWHRLDLRIWRSPLWSQKQTGQLITILVLVLSTFLFSFPGEWHINLLSGRSLVSRDCTRWLPGTFGLHIDRLVLKDLGTGSDETSKTANNTPNGADLSKAASLRDWSDRDFACGTFVGVDFHRTILDRAHLEGGVLTNATIDSTTRMEGVYLEDADLSGLTLFEVKFLGAHLNRAKLSEAKLTKPNLRRADLTGIDLSGATLTDPEFEEGAYPVAVST